jgi:hypothetical protein
MEGYFCASGRDAMRSVPLLVGAVCLALAAPAYGLSLVDSNFDQIERLDQLGAVVLQTGGGAPGARLRSSLGFLGSPGPDTGITVVLPEWVSAANVAAFNGGRSSKPGNSSNLLIGPPTDATFTLIGAGGPDGGAGDGSVEFDGGRVDLLFASPITAPVGEILDLFIVTGTPSTAQVRFTLLSVNGGVLNPRVTVQTGAGPAGSGVGGILLDVPDGITYSGLRLDQVRRGTLEVDGAFALVALPEPSSALMFAGALVALAFVRRR